MFLQDKPYEKNTLQQRLHKKSPNKKFSQIINLSKLETLVNKEFFNFISNDAYTSLGLERHYEDDGISRSMVIASCFLFSLKE